MGCGWATEHSFRQAPPAEAVRCARNFALQTRCLRDRPLQSHGCSGKKYLRIPTPQPRAKRDSCNRQNVPRGDHRPADAHASAHRCKGSTADARPEHTRKRLKQEPALCSVQVGECGDRGGDGSLQRHIPCTVIPDGSAAAQAHSSRDGRRTFRMISMISRQATFAESRA